MRSIHLRQRRDAQPSLTGWMRLAWLNVALSVRCDGNAKTVKCSLGKLEVRGDHEQLLWTLCKPAQQAQGIGAVIASHCRYPNMLTVPDSFSPNTVKMCFAEVLEGHEQMQNALSTRDSAISESDERLKEVEAALESALEDENFSESETADLRSRLQAIRAKLNDNIETTKKLNPDSLRKAYRLVQYDIDLDAIVSQLKLGRDKIREMLGKEVDSAAKTALDDDPRAYVAEQDPEKVAEVIVQKYIQCSWRMEDLIKLKIAQAKPYNEHVYYRYDRQAKIMTAERWLPQLDIYRPWKVLSRFSDVSADANSQIRQADYEALLEAFEAKQKSLRQCLSYAILRITKRKLSEIMSKPMSSKAEALFKKLTNFELTTSASEDHYQTVTAALVRQEDAFKDFTEETSRQKTKEEKQLEEHEAEGNRD